MIDKLLPIIEEFSQFCRDNDIHGYVNLVINSDDGYFHIDIGNEFFFRVSPESPIRHEKVETSTTKE